MLPTVSGLVEQEEQLSQRASRGRGLDRERSTVERVKTITDNERLSSTLSTKILSESLFIRSSTHTARA